MPANSRAIVRQADFTRRLVKVRDAVQTIGNLIDKAGVAFIASVDDKGFPNIKAMLPPRKREGIKYFYFTTNTSSLRVRQYRDNPKASIYFCDRRFFGVMLTDGGARRLRLQGNDLAGRRHDVLSSE
jgi:predicted pyridoxine 5'-phosphate oxidase superfamily flavin-nucleotide-binding protein